MSEPKYCHECQDEMNEVLDEDLNGDVGHVCARCIAEQAHDFDAEPDAVFGRDGIKESDRIPFIPPVPIPNEITTEVKNCARCCGDHKVTFKKLRHKCDEYTHWAMCPSIEEPILMLIE